MRYWRNLYVPFRLIVYSSPNGIIFAEAGTSSMLTSSTALLSSQPAISFFTASTHFLQSARTSTSKKSLGQSFTSLGAKATLFPSISIATIEVDVNFRFSTVRSRNLQSWLDPSSTQITLAIPFLLIEDTVPKHLSGWRSEYDPGVESNSLGETEIRSPTFATILCFPIAL